MSENDAGRFVWYDLLTTDTKAAAAFYGEVVGWKTQAWEGSHYTLWVGSQGPLGGVMELPDEAKKMGAPPHWMANVTVADVDKSAARARELGGKVHREPSDIPSVGRFAVIADPQGASLSIFKPADAMGGQDTTKPGAFCWNELLTTDAKAGFAFYHELFGWEHLLDHDMGPMGTYLIYGRGGERLGGMFTMPREMKAPPSFLYYVQVASLEAALACAKRLGAKVLNGPMEVPGGAHVVTLLDPQGAAFSLHELAAVKPAA
jgi:hypothetical protein